MRFEHFSGGGGEPATMDPGPMGLSDIGAVGREYPQFGKSVWNVGKKRGEGCGCGGSCGGGGSCGCGVNCGGSSHYPAESPVGATSLAAGPFSQGPARDDPKQSNLNVTVKKLGPCMYSLTLHLWVNEDACKKNGCKPSDIEMGKQQIEDAVKKYWGLASCSCPPPSIRSCDFYVQVKWEKRGSPTIGSGSMSSEEEAAAKKKGTQGLKRGSPAEVYFKCGAAPRKRGEHLGEARRGNESFGGSLWVHTGEVNVARGELLPATAHEVGHTLAGGSYHSRHIDDLMYPEVRPEGPVDYLDSMGPAKVQDVGNTTACMVVEMFQNEGMCKDCCPDKRVGFMPRVQHPVTAVGEPS